METSNGARGGDGTQEFPNHGVAVPPSQGAPIASEGTPEFFPAVPPPARGVMFRRCCVCKADLGSVSVDAGDDCNGRTSHGYCDPCQAKAMKEAADLAPTGVHFTDLSEDGHAIAHETVGARYCSESAAAFVRAMAPWMGGEPLPGGVW